MSSTKEVDIQQLLNYSPIEISKCLNLSWEKFISSKKSSKDRVVHFMMQFMEVSQLFVDHEDAVKRGDAIAIELSYPDLLLIFQAVHKNNYVNLIIVSIIESMYKYNSPASLQEMRKNRFVRLSNVSSFMGIDEFNELINFKVKRIE